MADQGSDPSRDETQPTPATTAAAPAAEQEQAGTEPQEAKKEERGEQKVTIEDAGPARKRLTIEIPAERIKKKIEENYGKLKTEATLPGFRRGRAPMRLLQKRFAESVSDDVKAQILAESYSQAVEEEKLEVLGEPEVKDAESIKLPEDGPLTFKVEVEITPKFELPALDGIELKKPKLAVQDSDVDVEIEQLRERFGKLVPVADATVAAHDYVLADVQVLAGANATPLTAPATPAPEATPGAPLPAGTEISRHPGAYVHVPGPDREYKGHVLGIIVNDLGQRLAGKKTGETVSISLTGPTGHEDERIKDKPITLFIKIERVERLDPAPVEALVQQFGVEGPDQLKTQLRTMLDQRNTRAQQNALHEQVTQYLDGKVQMDLPEGVSRRQAARLLHRQAMEMAYRGTPEQEIEQRLAELRAGSEEAARKQLKQMFILEQAAKTLEVDVSEGEVNNVIYSLAMQRQRRPEKLRQELQRSGQLEQLYLNVRDHKTLDAVVAKAKVVEVEPAELEKKEDAKA